MKSAKYAQCYDKSCHYRVSGFIFLCYKIFKNVFVKKKRKLDHWKKLPDIRYLLLYAHVNVHIYSLA